MESSKPNGVHEQMVDAHPPIKAMKEAERVPNRLILCFDGTGNSFQGNTADTNIVKLYDKFDRSNPHQMHYYQPGIGTYSGDGSSINASWWGNFKRSVSQTVDQGVATTFDSHVIAGYRFLMRYYGPGDRIYIFGFSRGAFTARFLARMVSQVGLLSMGNEEMVPFAYKLYQDYETGVYEERKAKANSVLVKEGKHKEEMISPELKTKRNYITNFKTTFCRHEHAAGAEHNEDEAGIKVHFLGLFDTVNSVGNLDIPFTQTPVLPKVGGTAEHVRHAVAIDERRVKFKVALLAQDTKNKSAGNEDVKEVWFPGNHGDVGGGWPAVMPSNKKTKDESKPSWKAFWNRLHRFFHTEVDLEPSEDASDDPFQQSDIPLKWMIDELDGLESDKIEWDLKRKNGFLHNFHNRRHDAIKSRLHDTMKFGHGCSWGKVMFWNFMDYLPFIKRWEYVKGMWQYVTFPLNRGGTRDIPPGAVFHHSVLERLNNAEMYAHTEETHLKYLANYKPMNDVFKDNSTVDTTTPLHKVVKAHDGKLVKPSFVPQNPEMSKHDKEVLDSTYTIQWASAE